MHRFPFRRPCIPTSQGHAAHGDATFNSVCVVCVLVWSNCQMSCRRSIWSRSSSPEAKHRTFSCPTTTMALHTTPNSPERKRRQVEAYAITHQHQHQHQHHCLGTVGRVILLISGMQCDTLTPKRPTMKVDSNQCWLSYREFLYVDI